MKTESGVLTTFNRFSLILLIFCFLLSGCAHQVSPEGGPRDTTPPKINGCEPLNFSTRFRENSFKIEFNEFINLKNPLSEIFISPPLKSPVDPRLRGKSLIVRINDTLAPETTYSITFGNSITDITENNALNGFTYVFSTGDYIDSLSLQGTLLTAFDHKPQKDVYVELYLDNHITIPFDSLPLKVPPYYITKTDDQGNFIFHNLQKGPFKLFALLDQNSDLIFNQFTEKIAFCDSLVKPYYIDQPINRNSSGDSTMIDTSGIQTSSITNIDSLANVDSVRHADSIHAAQMHHPSYSLFLFEETDSIQRIQKATVPLSGLVQLVFRFPAKQVRITPLNIDSLTPWHLEEISRKGDSIRLWITRPDIDSLIARVVVDNKVMDTIRLSVLKAEETKKSKGKSSADRLILTNPASVSGLNQFKNKLSIFFSYPLIRWDFKKVLLITAKDTVHPDISFADSLKRRIIITHHWEESKSYKLLIPDSVFYGINQVTHDSVMMDFRSRAEKDFGNLIVSMNMDNRPGQYIIQLVNEKETIVFDEKIVRGSEKIKFNFMPPGKYRLKAIHDRNGNGRWDTGKYRMNIQPEEVSYFQKVLEIRANWDVEEQWN